MTANVSYPQLKVASTKFLSNVPPMASMRPKISIDTTKVTELLARNAFGNILQSEEHFLAIFLLNPSLKPESYEHIKQNIESFRQKLIDSRSSSSIISKDRVVKLHTCISGVQGGAIFKALLNTDKQVDQYRLALLSKQSLLSKISDSQAFKRNKNLAFASKNAAELLVETIYFGHQHLIKKLLPMETIPKEVVFELLKLAHILKLQFLSYCACNLLSACVQPGDSEALQYYQELYASPYLSKILEALKASKTKNVSYPQFELARSEIFFEASHTTQKCPGIFIHTRKIKELLARNAFEDILQSEKYFLAAFFLNPSLEKDYTCARYKDRLDFDWSPKYYERVKQDIESLRQKLIDSRSSSSIDLFIHRSDFNYYISSECPANAKVKTGKIHNSVAEHLASALDALQINYEIKDCSNYLNNTKINTYILDFLKKYTIRWNISRNHTFLVPQKPLPKREENTTRLLFEQPDEKKDFIFISRDGIVKLHACILDVQGGSFFKALLNTDSFEKIDQYRLKLPSKQLLLTKETDSQIIKKNSDSTLASKDATELFVETIYLGHQHLMKKLLTLETIPTGVVFELLELAHIHKLQSLFYCACNLLSACVRPEDSEALQYYQELYASPYLSKILEALNASKTKNVSCPQLELARSKIFFEASHTTQKCPGIFIHTRKIKELLARNAFEDILQSEEHFLAAFFLKRSLEDDFMVKRYKDRLDFDCDPENYKRVKQDIESLRQKLIDSRSSLSINLFVHHSDFNYYISSECPANAEVKTGKVHDSVAQYLATALDTLQINYEIKDCSNYLDNTKVKTYMSYFLKKYTIHWNTSRCHTFLTPQKPLPKRAENTPRLLFEQPDKKKDFTFISRDGAVKLHTCILDVQESPIFKALLDNDAFKQVDQYRLELPSKHSLSSKESDSQTIKDNQNLVLASKETTELFVEYIYFGHHHLIRKLVAMETIPKEVVFELLELADMHELQPLFDCACNLLSACVQSEDIETLQYYQELYNSPYLLDILEALGVPESLPPQNLIKV